MNGLPGQPQGMQVPVSNQRSAAAVNVANFLRDNAALKARTGLLNNKEDVDFFRYKRFVRALMSDAYRARQQNPKSGLPPVAGEQEAAKVFVMLILSQMVVPVTKLHTAEVRANRLWTPSRHKPTLVPSNKANLEPNAYFGWTYAKPNPLMLVYALLTVAAIFAVILFPLWPNFMKRGVWYLLMGFLGLIAAFFGVAIVRLVVYVVTLVALPRAFWLYPNLFEDCGVLESFRPMYAWEEKKKSKKRRAGTAGVDAAASAPEAAAGAPEAAAGSGAAPNATAATKRKVLLEEVADE